MVPGCMLQMVWTRQGQHRRKKEESWCQVKQGRVAWQRQWFTVLKMVLVSTTEKYLYNIHMTSDRQQTARRQLVEESWFLPWIQRQGTLRMRNGVGQQGSW
mmetsp:Transcript_29837/g.70899  ORF Transcript_29837/g.70899 Transcript_29837/m.70899 type:complete len:101 (-) Transcript_29837:1243-1545(-)